MNDHSRLKVAVYADCENLKLNGGFGMLYEKLRIFACRGGAEPIRLNAYLAYDNSRATNDSNYLGTQERLHAHLRDFGFKVITKKVKWYKDEKGNQVSKANVDLDLAVDAITQSEKLDRIVLATGDGDFVQVARALQNRGCRVEVIAFNNVSRDLRNEADLFMSGYLIPDLLPFKTREKNEWGEIDNYVRGVCYSFDTKQGFGFLRYIKDAKSDLWNSNFREENTAYGVAFLHQSELPKGISAKSLPTRNMIFEFKLADAKEKGVNAVSIRAISALS